MTPRSPRIFVSAGEASGDHYGADLLVRLRRLLPDSTFTGLGGHAMAAAGQQQAIRAEDVAVMGVTEILRHIPRIYMSYRRLVRSVGADRPDLAVLIDFPDVNFRLAKHLRRAGVPVVWLVSPQLWAWKRGRLRWVRERVDKMLVIFPFEERFYRSRGVDAEFIGHPLASEPLPLSSRDSFARTHGLDPHRIWIALLPGSRWKEIHANLPALHELAMSDLISAAASHTTFEGGRLESPAVPAAHARYEFLLPVASTIRAADLRRYIDTLNCEHLRYFGPEAATLRLTLVPDTREALFHARASAIASGTATIQAALIGNPFVLVYRVSPLTFAVTRRLVRYPEEVAAEPDLNGLPPIGMVNLVAGRRVVPELLQKNFTAANVASALAPLLRDGPEREAQMEALGRIRHALVAPSGAPEPIERVAEVVLALLQAPSIPTSEDPQPASI